MPAIWMEMLWLRQEWRSWPQGSGLKGGSCGNGKADADVTPCTVTLPSFLFLFFFCVCVQLGYHKPSGR
jgi:hypothetical protein